jgi:hypothetical protein
MYKLQIIRGSGWQGANWLLQIVVPGASGPHILKSFRTYEKAVEGFNRVLWDLDQLDDLVV